MIMQILTTIISFLFTVNLFGQVNDAESYFTGSYDKALVKKHQIKQITVQGYIDSNKSSLYLLDFDLQGLLIKQSIFDSCGRKLKYFVFTYNVQGDQIERKEFSMENNDTNIVYFSKIYDGTKLVEESSSALPFVKKYIYNDKGKKNQSITFLNTDTTMSAKRIFLYKYDKNGNLIEVEESFNDGIRINSDIIGKEKYIYNSNGNLINLIREDKANYEFINNKSGLLKTKTIIMTEEFNRLKIVDRYNYIFWKKYGS